MPVKREAIARVIPHSGAMCLLDEIASWDQERIRSVSRSHRAASNPLRSGGRLPALCGIEYAAQTMAAHGGLAGAVPERPRAGYLVSLRDVVCGAEWLDEAEGDLAVDAERISGDAERVMYRFRVTVGATEVLSGRATVVLDAEAKP
jgi:predicted hotdog family 3-hydroxylacyl-ACP dehydratase